MRSVSNPLSAAQAVSRTGGGGSGGGAAAAAERSLARPSLALPCECSIVCRTCEHSQQQPGRPLRAAAAWGAPSAHRNVVLLRDHSC